MGDTGLEPVTPCLSNESKAFFTNFITAWFSVSYVAITLTDNSLQFYFFPVESRGVLVISLESTTFWLQSDYSGKKKKTIENYRINYNKSQEWWFMFLCRKCGQVFNDKVSKHGKAKTPDRKLEYFPCDGEVVNTEISEIKRKRRIQYLINNFELR